MHLVDEMSCSYVALFKVTTCVVWQSSAAFDLDIHASIVKIGVGSYRSYSSGGFCGGLLWCLETISSMHSLEEAYRSFT